MDEKTAKERYASSTIISTLDTIYDFITWGDFAKEYFPDHSVSWFYNKMRGVDGNGGRGGFTAEERQQLRNGLINLATSIKETAEML